MDRSDLSTALAVAGKAAQLMPPMVNLVPDWLLARLTNRVMTAEDALPPFGYLPLRELVRSLEFDFQIVTEMHAQWSTLDSVQAQVLLIGGERSPACLKHDLDSLAQILPRATRVTLPRLGHAAAWNRDSHRNPVGAPEVVAVELRRFFLSRD
jgi:hypothetical protein